VHIHEKGDCSDPAAMNAGAHFNPNHGAHHGGPNTPVKHGGDLGSINVNSSGGGLLVVTVSDLSVDNVVGRSVSVHEKQDDLQSDPAGNSGDFDGAARKVGTTLPGGTVFRVIEFSPGVAPRVHRTDSIDYAVVLSGEIDMELEKGTEVHLKAGDVLVQRGTLHNWINRGNAPCVLAFVLVDAKPVEAGGKVLNAVG